jgi:hypothetical protein
VRVVALAALGGVLPVAVHHLVGALVAAEGEVAVVVVVVETEVPGFERAQARHPDGRVRLLDGLRPEVHVAELRVLAVPGERLALGPALT